MPPDATVQGANINPPTTITYINRTESVENDGYKKYRTIPIRKSGKVTPTKNA